jgi:hypothetical protein
MLLQIISFKIFASPLSQSRLCKADQVNLTYIILQRQLRHFKIHWLDCRHYAIRVWHRLALCCEPIHAHDLVWHFLVVGTFFLYNRKHTEGWKPFANRGSVSNLDNLQWCWEPCFIGAAMSVDMCLPQIPRRFKSLLFWSVLYGCYVVSALKCLFLNRE